MAEDNRSREELLVELEALRTRLAEAERRSTEHSLADSDLAASGLLETLLENVFDYVFLKDEQRRYVTVNRAFERLFRRSAGEILGKVDEDLFPPDIAALGAADDRRVLETGEAIINRLEGGEIIDGEQLWVLSTKVPWRDRQGRVIGLLGISRDITELKAAEDRQDLLIAELDHRVKNTLATVLALAEEQADRSESIADFQAAFRGRIRAMARAHEALARGHWHGADLGEITHLILSPGEQASAQRIVAAGDPVRLPTRAVQPVAQVLNELVTNARKHGSLSVLGGSVELMWALAADDGLRLVWTENDGPETTAPEHLGLGLTLIRGLIEDGLGGSLGLSFGSTGFRCEILIPLESPPQPASDTARKPAPTTDAQPGEFEGLRLLLVEDDHLQSKMMTRLLTRLGCRIIGPAGSVEEALSLARDTPMDGAILDANLQGRSSASVADALNERGCPFLLVTGYANPGGLSDAFCRAPRLTKPVEPAALAEALRAFRTP